MEKSDKLNVCVVCGMRKENLYTAVSLVCGVGKEVCYSRKLVLKLQGRHLK
jgi:hypothetical protein